MPALTGPASAQEVTRNPKRLVILCDGSWQSADKALSPMPSWPTNIVRLTRAIKPTTWVYRKNGANQMARVQVDQVTYYQSGVGTGIGDVLSGGAFGIGLSEKIRCVYGFLANNYVEGDTIAIFGFSRGAYTARAIGGLITGMGLLSKRGMDNFHSVYRDFYNADCDETRLANDKAYRDQYGLFKLDPGTIEVIGVFDTVGFHNPINDILPAWLRDRSLLRVLLGEQYELKNTELPKGVKYAFHALSLDEARIPFRPTLWFQRKDQVKSRSPDPNDDWDGTTLLEQVWFSGTHSHIGGGLQHSELSAIAFGWMASQLTKYNLLDLDSDYLLVDPAQGDSRDKWATKDKLAAVWYGNVAPGGIVRKIQLFLYNLGYYLLGLAAINLFTKQFQDMFGVRTPGRYEATPSKGHQKSDYVTNEYLHSSIDDRNLDTEVKSSSWPCIALRDFTRGSGKTWTSPGGFTSNAVKLKQAKVGDVERRCKNNLRDLTIGCLIEAPLSSKSKSSGFVEGVENNEMYY
ncbi:hypothetical protein BP6252_06772 [Coleophoma cylindrospora]|uniref:T6SS Phospholipase effector Tle1-like catalytic domain-containing protein n=1 Tax=Coleophoma cylindrospora TaxID=1849047 RepID=A0A3D8RFP2_9HELO|nr:hypothetical protein BP6252_06772 [Coleophoma cylindrospora]